MMDQSTTIMKLFRALQFRKHVKELTGACKRINKDGCYEFVTYRHGTSPKKSTKLNILRSKLSNYKERSKSSCRLSTRIRPKTEDSPNEQLAKATATSPANILMIVKQSYKPLHAKSSQLNKNTIAVTKDTLVNALYITSNWIFIQIPETNQTGFVPIYCLSLADSSNESHSQNNLSLLNVSVNEKQQISTPSSSSNGRFISSIGPCHFNIEQTSVLNKSSTYTRYQKDQSNLSRQISNMSLHAYDQDAYETLNLTPCRSLSFSVLDTESSNSNLNARLRVIETYQRKFVGDISVLESEVVTLVNNSNQTDNDWRYIRRGDGRQGYIPKHIVTLDRNNFN